MAFSWDTIVVSHALRNPKDHVISSQLGVKKMETPERQKGCDNEDFIPRRLLRAFECFSL